MKQDKLPLEDPPAYEDVVDSRVSSSTQLSTGATVHGRQPKYWRSKVLFFLGITGSVGAFLIPPQYPGQNIISMPGAPESWDSRKRIIDTGSTGLSAEYDLLDVLTIRSSSGSVDLGVNPQPADESNPKPAELSISTHSGSVNINFSPLDPPDRDYRTSIITHSGSIQGSILHGQKTSITSSSSSQQIKLVVHKAGNYSSSLSTASTSGSQDITVEAPLGKESSITEMASMHSAESGSLSLVYPREWEGTIEGRTKSGHIKLHGNDLEVIRKDSSGHHIVAKKGNGNSTLQFHTASGGVDIYFG